MDNTIQCPTGAGCVIWKLMGEGGVDLYLSGHIHYYARDLPEWPVANNGTGLVDTNCSSPNLGNVTNPIAVYTNPRYMVTIITAAPGDQEVNRRRAEAAPAAAELGAGQYGVTSTNNYGYGYLTITNASTLHWRFETAVPHVNSTAAGYTDDLWLVVDSHGPRTLPPM